MNNMDLNECVETLGKTIENIEEMLNEHHALITKAQADEFRSINTSLKNAKVKIAGLMESYDAVTYSECDSILAQAISKIEDITSDEENITTQQQVFFAQIYCLLEDAYYSLEE